MFIKGDAYDRVVCSRDVVPTAERHPTTTASSPPSPDAQALQKVCDAQAWPQPVPAVVGMVFDSVDVGALACWDDSDHVRGIAPDGHHTVANPTHDDFGMSYRITSISPPPGTPIGRNDTVTVQLVPVDWSKPPAFRPCDWVTTEEAAQIFGVPSVSVFPSGDEAGSVFQLCTYDTPGPGGRQLVGATRLLPASMVIDAPTQLDLYTANSSAARSLACPAALIAPIHGNSTSYSAADACTWPLAGTVHPATR
jgi:hypothetical protein